MIGLIWGLLGALFIGVSDGMAKKTTQTVPILIIILAIMAFSSLALGILFAATDNWPQWHAYAWTASAISGLLNLIGLAFLYHAIKRGPVAVASPASGSFSIMLVIINGLMGHPFSWGHMLAVILVFIGVVMLTQPDKKANQQPQYDAKWLRVTAYYGLAAATAISVRFYLAQDAGDILGPLPSLFLNRLFACLFTTLILVFMLIRSGAPSLPKGSIWWLVLLQAVLESLALWAFLTGSSDGNRIAATIGFSAYAAVSTLVAWLLFGEKVSTKSWLWIGIIALGVSIASTV
jgi:drug/metabolite transporter (DMT)-like permease